MRAAKMRVMHYSTLIEHSDRQMSRYLDCQCRRPATFIARNREGLLLGCAQLVRFSRQPIGVAWFPHVCFQTLLEFMHL